MGVEVSPRRIIILFLVFILCQLDYEFKYQSIAQELPDEEDRTLRQIADKLGLNTERFFRGFTCSSYEITCGSCDYNDTSRSNICHVTEIALSGSGLTGIIPEELANLTYLRSLNLKSNKLTGTIPASLGKLNSLSNLDLSDNQLSGPIPDSLWSQKSYQPPYYFECDPSHPTDRNCYNRKFDSFMRAPVALAGGSNDRVTPVPSDPKRRKIFRIVPVTLDLSSNQLSGPLPANLWNLSFKSVDPEFTGDPVVLNLDLSNNRLIGPIPESLGKLSVMTSLDLSNNLLNGSIPESLGSLRSMGFLDLQNNGLSGTLPQTLGDLTKLETFSVGGNNLSGLIPDFIANWTYILDLNLVGNHFHGGIPAGVFNLSWLNLLAISDVGADGADHRFPPTQNLPKLSTLILRNCSFTGPIPPYIGNMTGLRNLDLSFNSLTDGIPDSLEKLNLSLMSFSNNKLSGKIPDWIQNANGSKMDLSYNNFSKPTFEMSKSDLNLFSCCCNSSICLPNTTDPTTKDYCPRGKHKYHSLFINCGGGETRSSVDRNLYDQDNDTSQFHLSPKGNWARSSAGNTADIASSSNSSTFLKVMRCGLPGEEALLYNNARTSPVSLKYYGFCLRRGNYSVTLHFAEIGDDDNDSLRRLRTNKRLFDVYIQGVRKLQDFSITNKTSQENFTGVHVNEGTLEIHFYSAGIGLEQGPLISAISVTPEYKLSKRRLSPLHIALISVASIIVFLLLLLVFAWMMGWLGNTDHLKEIDIGLEKHVTLKQLKDATGNFSKRNEIGQGGFGAVYKAELSGKIVAVKKLSSYPEEEIEELKNEFKLLKQDNLVQLLDVYNAKGLHLLIYEYMQNISLENALLESKFKSKLNWEARFNICLGIARGLVYLHAHPMLKMKMVHTGIKSANILLDRNNLMNAKISDIGMARLYKEEDQFKIIKVKETEEYMAPEYIKGFVTSKADVYSFGVVILETVSGRKNTGHTSGHESEFLIDKACDLQRRGKLVDLVDKTLSNKYDAKQAIIILNLAVMCTNISPSVRPTMSDVLSVLKGDKKIEEICSPAPKEPIKEIAKFAVSEYNKKSGKKLELQSVVSDKTQAVAGQHYRLVLAVKDKSAEAKYEGVVYERIWEHSWELLSFDSHIAQVDSSDSMEATSRVSTSSSSIKGEDETEHISENTL